MVVTDATDEGHGPPVAAVDVTVVSVVDRAQRVGVVLLAVVEMLAAGAHLVDPDAAATGAVISAMLLAWAMFRCATIRRPRWRPVADVTVAAAYLLAAPLLVDGPSFTTTASPMLAVGGTAVVAMAIGCPPARSALVTVVVVGCWAWGAARVPGVGNPFTIFNLDFVVVEWGMAAVLRVLVVRAATGTDTALTELSRARTVADIARARGRAEREAWATMHDTAAATLSMLAQGVRVHAGVLRAQLRRDLRAVREGGRVDDSAAVDLAGVLAELGESTCTPLRYRGPAVWEVPAAIGTAVAAATREALVNVDRHAAAAQVSVELVGDRLTITDDGVGFDTTDPSVVGARHGVRHSIRRRLADAGVAVEIRSAAGAGTTIDITWRTAENTTSESSSAEHAERLLDRYGYGLVIVAAVITLMQSPQGLTAPHPVAQGLILLVVLAVTVIAGCEIRARIPAALWWAAVTAVIVAGFAQAALLAVKDIPTGANWAVSALGWQLAALSCRRSIRTGLVLLAVLWGGGALVLIGHGPGLGASITLVYTVISVVTLQIVAVVFSGLLRQTVHRSEQITAEITDVRSAAAVRRALHDDSLARMRRLSSELVPLLTRLLDTDDPAADPAVRARCLIESARLRRMFDPDETSTNPLIEELTVAISAAERRGIAVTRFIVGDIPDLAASRRSHLLTAPIIVLESAHTHARVVVTGTAGVTAQLSVTADSTDTTRLAAQAATPDGVVVTAGELVWTTVSLA